MDADAATWNSCRCRQCRFAFLFRTSKLDNRSSDLCRRRSITDESGSPSGNSVGVKDHGFRKQNRQHWVHLVPHAGASAPAFVVSRISGHRALQYPYSRDNNIDAAEDLPTIITMRIAAVDDR